MELEIRRVKSGVLRSNKRLSNPKGAAPSSWQKV
jgi:hypothetical protein